MYSTYERKNIYKSADEKTLKAIFDYSEGYKRFLAVVEKTFVALGIIENRL